MGTIQQMVAQRKQMDEDIASVRQTLNGIGEETLWQDLRISELEACIAYWTERYNALGREIARARATLTPHGNLPSYQRPSRAG